MLKTISEILSHNIRLHRKRTGLTQAGFAAKVDMIHRTYQAIESGETWPQLLNLEIIARGLNVHPSALFIDPDLIKEPTPEQAISALTKFVMRHK